jgi:hypothetical protein
MIAGPSRNACKLRSILNQQGKPAEVSREIHDGACA